MMIDMLSTVNKEFPQIFTRNGEVRKQAPKRYICQCGHEFNQTVNYRVGGLGFGIPLCRKCGEKGKKSTLYHIWKRMSRHLIEQEDYILNVVSENPSIAQGKLMMLVKEKFGNYDALGQLCYHSYLLVDPFKRDNLNQVEYTVNTAKDLLKRYDIH